MIIQNSDPKKNFGLDIFRSNIGHQPIYLIRKSQFSSLPVGKLPFRLSIKPLVNG